MRRRLLESLGVAAVLMALGMLLQASAVSVVAQAPADRATAGDGAGSENGVGPSRSAGNLARRVRYPARTARQVRQQGVPDRTRAGRTG